MPTLITSISGARGLVGDGLDACIIARLSASFGTLVGPGLIIIGRDSRPSGEHFAQVAGGALRGVGCDVCDLGIVTTPTVQVAVEEYGAAGGIVISASHNPPQWNALKFVGPDGRFLSPARAEILFRQYHENRFAWVPYERIGGTERRSDSVTRHIKRILQAFEKEELKKIRSGGFKVVVDAVRGAGGVLLLPLLEQLGVKVHPIDCEPDGQLPADPEPRTEVLGQLLETVRQVGADLGFRTDPDGDRLAVVTPGGEVLGEEWTLPLAAFQVLQSKKGPLVTNLSSSGRLEWVGSRFGVPVYRTPVGEAHVVLGILKYEALIGGEGNGGVIDPQIHLGRDSGVGIARLLALESSYPGGVAGASREFPSFFMVKVKLPAPDDLGELEDRLRGLFSAAPDRSDGLRWLVPGGWIHIRKSGTEPAMRLTAETATQAQLEEWVEKIRRVGRI
ncbi:MAG: phosphoglucosamine mutase [Candidatus Eisenbacteria bacterium]|uniref:Phosphoglucosamine mutase n=1 Tax=Eiseniibacteriota bacterium TaxID=2212470 RepID=A0A948W7C5_UNCEI|nr:phosphoglucosamine mutase [Candidatus Eisenbacteria bacterium]MBU1947365.1 phosphoglucosamine mutase [Candidatus Eisenbacteria bacterium]MBU2692454.1 phosphoglucosamine mutase [Candidatus Eisenbacteria bacterium]